MAGWVTNDDLLAEVVGMGKRDELMWQKGGSASMASGVWHSLWKEAGRPGAGADPATTPGTSYTGATAGSLRDIGAVTTDLRYLLRFGVQTTTGTSQVGTMMLYDRLVGVSGISVASTGAKTVNSTALPRWTGTDAANVQCWLEVTTATATTAVVCSLDSYTNEAGTTGRAGGSITFPAAATTAAQLVGPMPIQNGDKGIRSVEAGLNVATAASAGIVNVILIRPIAYLPMIADNFGQRFWYLEKTYLDNMGYLGQQIKDDACLALARQASGTGANITQGIVHLGYG